MSIYHSITNLPLSRFIDCIVDNNLYALIISGTPTDPTQLHKAWENILQEYSAAIGSSEYKLYLSLYREISIIEIEYESILTIVEAIRSVQKFILLLNYNVPEDITMAQKKMCGELNKILHTSCRFNNLDDASFQEELNKCLRRRAGVKINLDLKIHAFNAIQKKHKDKDVKMDRAYFDSMLITISDHAKYEIGEDITVSKYCERIKRYNQYCENLKNHKRG